MRKGLGISVAIHGLLFIGGAFLVQVLPNPGGVAQSGGRPRAGSALVMAVEERGSGLLHRKPLIGTIPAEIPTSAAEARAMGGEPGPAEGSEVLGAGTTEAPALRIRGNSRPEYPILSRRAGEQGVVTARLLVSPGGDVLEASLLRSSGFSRLDRSGLEFLRQVRFEPLPGLVRPVEKIFELVFNLSEPAE